MFSNIMFHIISSLHRPLSDPMKGERLSNECQSKIWETIAFHMIALVI